MCYIIIIEKRMGFDLVTDLTRGKPLKMILQFCLPLMGGQIFQQLYNMVDSIIVGRFAGTAELSAVGSTGALSFMVIGFIMGMCTGFSIPVSQAFGEQNFSKMRRYFVNSVYLTAIISGILTMVTLLLVRQVLHLMNTPDDIFEMAYSYISIIFMGLTATMFYNLFSCVMRALGDSKTPLYLLIFSSLVNIVLDLIFVIYLGMAVKGVAIATVIAQSLSAVLAFVVIAGKFRILKPLHSEFRPSAGMCGRLLYIGAPMALQISVTAIGSIMLQSAVNQLGSNVIAAVTVGGKIQLMLILPSETIGLTMATYCGQNLGARRIDRIREGIRRSILIATVYSAFSFCIDHFLGSKLALLFVTSEQIEVVRLVGQFLKCCSWFYPFLSFLFIYRNSIQGLGYSIPAMLAGAFELSARAIMGFVIIPKYGYDAVCFANPSAWIAAMLFLVPVYYIVFSIVKKKITKGEIKV